MIGPQVGIWALWDTAIGDPSRKSVFDQDLTEGLLTVDTPYLAPQLAQLPGRVTVELTRGTSRDTGVHLASGDELVAERVLITALPLEAVHSIGPVTVSSTSQSATAPRHPSNQHLEGPNFEGEPLARGRFCVC